MSKIINVSTECVKITSITDEGTLFVLYRKRDGKKIDYLLPFKHSFYLKELTFSPENLDTKTHICIEFTQLFEGEFFKQNPQVFSARSDIIKQILRSVKNKRVTAETFK